MKWNLVDKIEQIFFKNMFGLQTPDSTKNDNN